jgi:hypothetical protein
MSDKRKNCQQHHEPAADHQQPASQGRNNSPTIYSVIIQPSSGDAEKQAAENKYRKQQLRIGVALNWITAIGTVVGLRGLVYLWGTLKATQSAARTAQEALHISERAYISLGGPVLNPPAVELP